MRRCLIPICALCLLAATTVAAGDHPVAVAVCLIHVCGQRTVIAHIAQAVVIPV